MKKLVLSFLLMGALAVVGSAQTIQKTTSNTQPAAKTKMVTKTSSSPSAAQANNPAITTTQKTAMTKPKHKHHPLHKAKQKTTTK